MIRDLIVDSRTTRPRSYETNRYCIINNLIESRNIYSTQKLDYDLRTVCCMDLFESSLLVGLSNGSVDLLGVDDATLGNVVLDIRYTISNLNIHRVQWNPGEPFFSVLDNHNLYLVDALSEHTLERFNFGVRATWSEWNPNDKKMVAVCGSESQVRLVDIRSGSSVQTVIVEAKSGLASHRATRCLWSNNDINCLIVGDNEGYIHVYDTRYTSRSQLNAGEDRGQISGMSFTCDNSSIITSQGTANNLIQWHYDKCKLVPIANKFRKRKKEIVEEVVLSQSKQGSSGKTNSVQKNQRVRHVNRRQISLSVDANLRCQFYVTDRHLYCPVSSAKSKSKEVYIYDIESGLRIKTLKSDDILCEGIYSVRGLLPDALVLYAGGRGRLRVWTIDENHELKLKEKMNKYHTTRWDSDDDDL